MTKPGMLARCARRMNYGSVAEFFDLQRHRVRRILVKRIGHEILPETGEPVVLTLDDFFPAAGLHVCSGATGANQKDADAAGQ